MGRLNELKTGECGYITCIISEDDRLVRRLTDMGMTAGTKVRVVKFAPLGDPMVISLRGYLLSIRKSDAAAVELSEDMYSKTRSKEEFGGLYSNEHMSGAEANEKNDKYPHSCVFGCAYCEANCKIREYHHKQGKNLRSSKNAGGASAIQKEGRLVIALAGNPNSGKTTLYNAITGGREYVGNWAGVTVEKKERRLSGAYTSGNTDALQGKELWVVDLPGIYSMSSQGMEERIACDYIIQENPALIINIVDATNMERNLYLTLQLLELGRPMLVALNMMDVIEDEGGAIDCKAISESLGIPIVPISAGQGRGLDKLIDCVHELLSKECEMVDSFQNETVVKKAFAIDGFLDKRIAHMRLRIAMIIREYAYDASIPLAWASRRLLEGDDDMAIALKLPNEIKRIVQNISANRAASANIADSLYRSITELTSRTVHRGALAGNITTSERIDRILMNKYLAIPIFLLIIGTVFFLTFGSIGAWLKGLTEKLVFDTTIPLVARVLHSALAPQWFISLVCDGILSGVGGVLTFLPEIFVLFLSLSMLEDSGYMSRIAFITDRPMRKLGLSGKSFIPLLMGFGCTVPAAMAARTTDSLRDKRSTILLLPFMSCSAKLPVYALLAGAFFGHNSVLVVLSLYIGGILLAVAMGALLSKAGSSPSNASFMLEFPRYRLPKLGDTLSRVWVRIKHFLIKAGTLILAMSVVIWVLVSFDPQLTAVGTHTENSILGRMGNSIAFVFLPIGFGNWIAVVSLLAGLIAKESIVSTLSVLVGATLTVGTAANALGGVFTPASAYSFLVFTSLYTPCVAAIATMSRELQSKRLAVFSVLFQLAVAYAAALFAYTIARLLF